ncbi:LysR family transcriptional regulator [Curvivirga sp.]|uniref:LysR family transcriptional regulator n=1 Tax=Curvivirga sp. TaxID=2856848 RepID=UPI003B59510B
MPVEPPRPKGPPLNALRAFESAARLGSFKLAAEELCVTAGAVAQHIKALEEWTTAPLFIRHAQGVELTELGNDILPKFITAFDHLGEAIHSLKSWAKPDQIRIAALPSIAQLWLTPRLPKIRREMADIQISVTALETAPNLTRESFDISIFYGIPQAHQISLGQDFILPLCNEEIASKINAPADLIQFPLLHDQAWQDDWQKWILRFAPDLSNKIAGPSYSLYSLAVEETLHGAGILMGRQSLLAHHIANNNLIAPLNDKLECMDQLIIEIAQPVAEQENIRKLIDLLTQ